MKTKKTKSPKNIYGNVISTLKPISTKDKGWADQELTWKFSTPDWSRSVRMEINIVRTDANKIKAILKKKIGRVKNFVFEPAAGDVMKVMRP